MHFVCVTFLFVKFYNLSVRVTSCFAKFYGGTTLQWHTQKREILKKKNATGHFLSYVKCTGTAETKIK